MAGGDVRTEVAGLDNLKRTLGAAERDLKDSAEADRQAAAVVASSARARAPKVSGRLAASVHPVPVPGGYGVAVGTAYGGVILHGWAARNIAANPFVTEAAAASLPAVTEAYHRNIDTSLRQVKGI